MPRNLAVHSPFSLRFLCVRLSFRAETLSADTSTESSNSGLHRPHPLGMYLHAGKDLKCPHLE